MSREVPISPKQLARLGWRSQNPQPGHKLTGRWVHVDGWTIVHCGHPTANWPYALYDAHGRMHCTGAPQGNPTCGYAWRTVRRAVEYVALHGAAGIKAMDAAELAAPTDVRRRAA